MITELARPSADQGAAILALAHETASADGVAPLNEAAELALEGANSARHWLVSGPDDEPVGYAQYDPRDGSAQLFIAPTARRAGLGRALAEQLAAAAAPRSWWSFGDLPAARALAAALGLQVVRCLLKMSLDASTPLPAPRALPIGLHLDHFRAGDLDWLVAANAAAFADHPEQGALTASDFSTRMAAEWYRDEDLLVARDASGVLVGYHWTKLEPIDGELIGEVYVLGVDPAAAGGGVGSALLDAGIMQMRARGAVRIDLYVEAANTRVVELYRKTGFGTTHTDVAYGPTERDGNG